MNHPYTMVVASEHGPIPRYVVYATSASEAAARFTRLTDITPVRVLEGDYLHGPEARGCSAS